MSSEAEKVTAPSYPRYLHHSSPYTPYLSLRLAPYSFLLLSLSLIPLLFYPLLLHLHHLLPVHLSASSLRYLSHLHVHPRPLVLRHPLSYFPSYLLLSHLPPFFLPYVSHHSP